MAEEEEEETLGRRPWGVEYKCLYVRATVWLFLFNKCTTTATTKPPAPCSMRLLAHSTWECFKFFPALHSTHDYRKNGYE
jgi:hypothetical protein